MKTIDSDGRALYWVHPKFFNKPVNFVSWLSGARFVNWLENGQPGGGQVEGVTETGSYDLAHTNFPMKNVRRSPLAHWAIPSYSEWQKAAYYDPTREPYPYWHYASRTDTFPLYSQATEWGDLASPGYGVCNYYQAANWNSSTKGNLTTVGSAGLSSATFFGAFDMNGNVAEFIELAGCVTPYDCGRYWLGGDARCKPSGNARELFFSVPAGQPVVEASNG